VISSMAVHVVDKISSWPSRSKFVSLLVACRAGVSTSEWLHCKRHSVDVAQFLHAVSGITLAPLVFAAKLYCDV